MNDSQKMSRRAFLRTSSMVAMGAALAACAPVGTTAPAAEGGAEAAAAPAGEKISLRMHARIGQQEDTLYDMQIPKFMAENPNIEVVKESFPGAEYNAKISTMVAGGTLGDVAWSALGGATIQFAYAQNTIQAIDDLVASNNVDLTQWYEGCLKGITVDGKLLGLPFKSHPGLAFVYYNQSLFEEAGLELPKAGWTQDQHVEAAKALHKADANPPVYGFYPGIAPIWKTMVTLVRSFGDQLVSEDGTTFQITSDKAMQAVTWLYDLHHTHKVTPLPDQIVGAPNDMWADGSLATYQGGSSVSVTAGTIGDKFKWMVAPNAVGPGGVGGSDYEVDAQCVTTATQHPNEAFKWVQYLCSKDSGIQLGLIGGTVGGRPDVYGSPELLAFPFRVVFKEVMDNAQASRITANWRQSEAEAALAQLMQPLWTGEEKPTEAFIGNISTQIQDIMSKPKP